MSTDLLVHLQALADSATSEGDRCVYRAQRACALARLGQIEAARTEVAALRAANTSYAPGLTAWIFVAEGLADHFESLSIAAADRFKRAYGLAAATRDREVQAMAAAWLGASEYLMEQYEAACLHAAEAIDLAPPSGALARSRAHLVLANCLYGFGAEAAAAVHFAKARQSAIDARDISMQSAILYNVAAFHISRLSYQDAFDVHTADETDAAELELNSITNLDRGLGVGSLASMVPLLRAQIMLLRKEWARADALYSATIAGAAAEGQARLAPRYLAEQAQCQAMLGRAQSASTLIDSALGQLSDRTELDDRAACHARVALCLTALGREAEAQAQAEVAHRHRDAFTAFQLSLRDRLVSIASGANGDSKEKTRP